MQLKHYDEVYDVKDVDEAVDIFLTERDRSGKDLTSFKDGFLYRGGILFATISFNGKVWNLDGSPY